MASADNQSNAPEAAGVSTVREGDALRVRFTGAWKGSSASPDLGPVLRDMDAPGKTIRLEGRELAAWDSRLLTVLLRLRSRAQAVGKQVDTSAMPDGVTRLLALALAAPEQTAPLTAKRSVLAGIGQAALGFFEELWDNVTFLGESLLALAAGLRGRARCRTGEFALLLQECGPQALPIITLLSLLVGMILAFLGSIQLKLFGAQLYVADLVAIGMFREMGALMTGIIMAGRTGAAFAAKLAAMQVNEETDALVTTGFPPMEFLVLPRMAALILVMPVLTLYADVLGILGGALVGVGMLDLTAAQYLNETVTALAPRDIVAGLIKSLAYGFVIALAGCRQGLRCGRNASAVGEATTRAVVLSIVGIIVWDSLITILYTITGF